jgi:signal transduction histidine kinase
LLITVYAAAGSGLLIRKEVRAMDDEHLHRELQSLSGLCGYLQDRSERDRNSIANQLHDEIGGLLVAARLNVAWIEQRLPSEDPQVIEHFKRLHDALRHGVEVKRRIVEDLRPTLLDNIGLYSALRWQMSKTCEPAKLAYTEHYPEEELPLIPEAAIIVYRVMEEAISNLIRHAGARNAHLLVQETSEALRLALQDDGIGMTPVQRQGADTFGIASMNYRAARLGGRLHWLEQPERGTELLVEFPLARLLRAPA